MFGPILDFQLYLWIWHYGAYSCSFTFHPNNEISNARNIHIKCCEIFLHVINSLFTVHAVFYAKWTDLSWSFYPYRCPHWVVGETMWWTLSHSASSTPKNKEHRNGMLHGDSSSGKKSSLPGMIPGKIWQPPTWFISRWSGASSLESTDVTR